VGRVGSAPAIKALDHVNEHLNPGIGGFNTNRGPVIESTTVAIQINSANKRRLHVPRLYAVRAGVDLFAIGSWRSRTFARWILMLLILSTVIGPIGFFTPSLAVLFAASGILFGIGFLSAGISMWLPRRRSTVLTSRP
jgi:hypothetical protein